MDQPRLFAGLGAAIEEPAIVVEGKRFAFSSIAAASTKNYLSYENEFASFLIRSSSTIESRIVKSIEGWSLYRMQDFEAGRDALKERKSYALEVLQTPPAHSGFGSGTQIDSSVIHLLENLFHDSTSRKIPKSTLAQVSGRGLRSSIGLETHLHGGFVVDFGLDPQSPKLIDSVRERTTRIEVSNLWRAVLIQPQRMSTVSGNLETSYFERSQSPNPNRDAMFELAIQIAQSVESVSFDNFANALFEYGSLAGQVFEKVQGGVYRDKSAVEIIEWLQHSGYRAVGQSSWGPTLFAIVDSEETSRQLVQDIDRAMQKRQVVPVQVIATKFANQGFTINDLS